MIHAIRLRERNKKQNFMMRSYTTASGTKFECGINGLPSPVRIVDNDADLDEVRAIPQFEIIEAESERALLAMLRREMELRTRSGAPAVHAEIIPAVAPAPRPVPKPAVTALITPTAIGEDEADDEPLPAVLPPPVPPPAAPEDEPEHFDFEAEAEVEAAPVSARRARKGRKPQHG